MLTSDDKAIASFNGNLIFFTEQTRLARQKMLTIVKDALCVPEFPLVCEVHVYRCYTA